MPRDINIFEDIFGGAHREGELKRVSDRWCVLITPIGGRFISAGINFGDADRICQAVL